MADFTLKSRSDLPCVESACLGCGLRGRHSLVTVTWEDSSPYCMDGGLESRGEATVGRCEKCESLPPLVFCQIVEDYWDMDYEEQLEEALSSTDCSVLMSVDESRSRRLEHLSLSLLGELLGMTSDP